MSRTSDAARATGAADADPTGPGEVSPSPSTDPATGTRGQLGALWIWVSAQLPARLGPVGSRAAVTVFLLTGAVLGGWWLTRPASTAVPTELLPFAEGVENEASGGQGAGEGGVASASAPSPSQGTDDTATDPSTSDETGPTEPGLGSEVTVHVVGAVVRPGVYQLAGDGRVADAVALAGGSGPNADLERINLAEVLTDGSRIYVPGIGEEQPPTPVAVSGGAPLDSIVGAAPADPVDVNTADLTELQRLPGVGPAIAGAILETRTTVGPFPNPEALLDVPGIGPAKLEGMRSMVLAG